jgi:cytidylate kinase
MKKITIAIDGHSSCGKSTLAKSLAKDLNYIFIDTGSMYRAVTLFAYENNWISESFIKSEQLINNLHKIKLEFEVNPQTNQLEIKLNGRFIETEIRNMYISNLVSKIASIKEVRTKLVEEQRKIGKNGGVIMDGRDIGSVVFPQAELKLFITAAPKVRAQRRFNELIQKGQNVSFDEVLQNLTERDMIDSCRSESPLIQTDDAILIDNSNLSVQEQFDLVQKMINKLTTPKV